MTGKWRGWRRRRGALFNLRIIVYSNSNTLPRNIITTVIVQKRNIWQRWMFLESPPRERIDNFSPSRRNRWLTQDWENGKGGRGGGVRFKKNISHCVRKMSIQMQYKYCQITGTILWPRSFSNFKFSMGPHIFCFIS